MVVSIRNTAIVRCSVGVRFSEGPLWEVPLYYPFGCIFAIEGEEVHGERGMLIKALSSKRS